MISFDDVKLYIDPDLKKGMLSAMEHPHSYVRIYQIGRTLFRVLDFKEAFL